MLQLINFDAWARTFRAPPTLIDWVAWVIVKFDPFWWNLLGYTLLVVGCVWVAACLVVAAIRDLDWYW